MLCVRIRTLCPATWPINLTASAICSQHCFPDCVLLDGKDSVLYLNPYRKFCRLYSPIRYPGKMLTMHRIPAAPKPVHIRFPHVLRLCGQDPILVACRGLSLCWSPPSPSSQPPAFPINLPLLPLPLSTPSRFLYSRSPCNMMYHPVGGEWFMDVRLPAL